jgi:1,4-alpha-glucan branching enzyme
MYQSDIEWKVTPNRYSAKKMTKPVNFACFAPKARVVTIAGNFNRWDKDSVPMARQPDGAWTIQLQMNHGHHQYAFFVDGHAALDPKATGTARHPQHGKVSLISIS